METTNIGFIQVAEQTHEEKLQMYMKLSKKELAEMLINANDLIDKIVKPYTTSLCGCDVEVASPICGCNYDDSSFCGCDSGDWSKTCPSDMMCDWGSQCPRDMISDWHEQCPSDMVNDWHQQCPGDVASDWGTQCPRDMQVGDCQCPNDMVAEFMRHYMENFGVDLIKTDEDEKNSEEN